MSVRLRLAKEFSSLQGEGHMVGTPMYFIRTAGCSIAECPLHPGRGGVCDTDWSETLTDDIEAVAERAENSGLKWVCITGGEPTDQLKAVEALALLIRNCGQRVMIQTSGVRRLADIWDWVAVSPKTDLSQLKQATGHELKLVWTGQDETHLREILAVTRFQKYFLQPLYQPDGSANLRETAAMVMECGQLELPWRLGIQQHKVWDGE